MESWRTVWRNGFAPVISTAALQALRQGLASDDVRLLQGATTSPPPMMCVQDWPLDAGCFLVFGCWQSGEAQTVGDAEKFFARACHEADQALKEPAACRYFINWYDDTPRDNMRRLLLDEVDLALARRGVDRPLEAKP